MRRMSEDQLAIPHTLTRCIESLAFCHTQDELRWPAARVVAQQDIDEFMRDAGPDLANQRRALSLLMAEFDRMFPHPADPVLIRSYARRQIRRIGFEMQRVDEDTRDGQGVFEIAAPETAPTLSQGDLEADSEPEFVAPQSSS
jgi:hypothetical protein